jgi:multidrug efflux system outer membrane protein
MAERELAASIADIGVETADLFPKFFVTGDAGSQARVFGDVFSAAGGMWSLGSLVQWPIFEGGAIRARIKAEEAESEAALAAYEQSVLNALADTESALTRYGQELETRKRLAEGVKSRRESAALASELFDAGEEDYLAVLDAERELAASEDNLVVSETNSITKLIALYAALGGGWSGEWGKSGE